MRTHICLCPCQCSQLEPLCIHTYANKYIYFSYYRFTDTFVYDCVVRTHICLCPCECSQLELLCIHRYIPKFTNFILQILLCMTSCCANSHMSVPLRLLTLRIPFCVHILTSIYNYIYIKHHITDTLVYRPVLCTLTLVCALANAQILNLFVYMHMLTNILMLYQKILLYITQFCANLQMVVPFRSAHT